MPDTISTARSLLIENLFIDGDTRTLTVKNPSSSITMNDIEEFNTFLQTSKILVGDRSGAEFSKIKTAVRRVTTTRKLEIT